MMDLETVADEHRLATQEPCNVCGNNNFHVEGGHYFCTTCNTQSQSARVYVDENFVAELQQHKRVATLRGDKEKQLKDKTTDESFIPTTWEIFNVVLKRMADRLVEIGFPDVVRNKIFHLYAAFLIRRKVIFVSKTNPAAKTTISIGDAKTNILTLYGYKGNKRRKKPRKRKVSEDKDDEGIEGQESEQLVSRAQKKFRATLKKKKAIEQEYRATEAATMAMEDAEFEKAINAPIADQSKPQRSHIRFTKCARLLRRKYGLGTNFRKTLSRVDTKRCNSGQMNTKRCRAYITAAAKLTFEHFTFRKCLILVFVALRQLGFHVVFADLVRLVRCDVFGFNNLPDLVKEQEDYKSAKAFNNFVVHQHTFGARLAGTRIHNFIRYMGMERTFFFPQMKEIVPKYIDDFVLPREFECFVNLLNDMYSLDEIVEAAYHPDMEMHRYTPEILVLAQMMAVLQMLFGLDDLTERYQSEFAKLVNKVIKDEARAHKMPMEEWTELFVIEEWFGYLRRRRDLIKREVYNNLEFTPNKPPTINKLNDLLTKNCSLNDEVQHQTKEQPYMDFLKTILNSRVSPGSANYPQLKPYVPLPLPNQSIVDQYLERHPAVADPSFKKELLKVDFVQKRIDFIWNPKKYTALLELCGYKVQIVRGNAANHFPNSVEPGTVLVFQPYTNFVESVEGLRKNCSSSLQLLLGICEDIVCIQSSENVLWKTDPDGTLISKLVKVMREVYVRKVLENKVKVMTRYDKDND